jgi:tetratricopeptide (TPR) repeat protein
MTYRVVTVSLQVARSLAIVAGFVGAAAAAAAQPTLRHDMFYECGGERFAVGSCRSESDQAGTPATPAAADYCDVWYPDRPKRNGSSIHIAELRGDILAKLQACQSGQAPVSSSAPSPSSAPGAPRTTSDSTAASSPASLEESAAAAAPSRNREAEFQLGKHFYEKGQYEDALRQFELVRKSRPNDAMTLIWIGDTQYQIWAAQGAGLTILASPEDALDSYQRAIQLKPEAKALAHAYLQIGAIKFEALSTTEAIAALKEAARLAPDDPGYCCLLLATSYMMRAAGEKSPRQYYLLAVPAYERTLSLSTAPDDSTFTALMGLGRVQSKLGRFDDAIATFNRMMPLKPPPNYRVQALGEIGVNYNLSKRYDQAVGPLLQALLGWPKEVEAVGDLYDYEVGLELGFANYMLGRYEDAVQALEWANHVVVSNYNYQVLLGITYLRMGRKDDALHIAEVLTASDNAADRTHGRQLLEAINNGMNPSRGGYGLTIAVNGRDERI